MSRFTPQTERYLRDGGWFSGRADDDFVEDCVRVLDAPAGYRVSATGFRIHAAARASIREFGGLRFGEVGPGVDFARSDIVFDPRLAEGEDDRLHEYFDILHGREAYPLGECHNGHAFLAVDASGAAYEVMDDIYLIADSVDALIETLLNGTLSQHCKRAG